MQIKQRKYILRFNKNNSANNKDGNKWNKYITSSDFLMGVPLTTTYTNNTDTNIRRLNTTRPPAASRVIEVMPADEIRKKEGELLKYKNVFQGWGKRYFRLGSTYLHYFQTKHTHEPLATVTRGEISQVKQSHAFPGRNNAFEIIQKSGVVWYCQASSPEEMVSWLQALSTVPVIVNPAQYPMVPADQAPPPNSPPVNNNFTPGPPPRYDSPYRGLMDQAHHTAYTSHTPHDCTHDSPPPPYYEGDRQHQQPPYYPGNHQQPPFSPHHHHHHHHVP